MKTPKNGNSASASAARIALAACAFAFIASLLSLAGWLFDIQRLTDWFGSGPSMQPNTTVAALLGSASLLGVVRGWRRAPAILAAAVGLIGLLTLLEHVSGLSLGIDGLLMLRQWGRQLTVVPGRMGPPASGLFVALGVSLMFAISRRERLRRLAGGLGIAMITVAALSMVGRLFGADSLYTLPRLTAIAPQTAMVLMALAVGVVCSVPDVDPVRTMVGDSASAVLVRRALPMLILVPLVLGWLRVTGQNAGYFDLAFGTAMRTIVEVLLLLSVMWWAARAVQSHERALARSQAELRSQSEKMAAIVESSGDAIVTKGLDGVVTSWNQGAEALFGYTAAQIVGKNIRLIIPPELWADDDAVVARLVRGESVEHYTTQRLTSDGRRVTISLRVSPLRDEHGAVVGVSKVARDVTRQNRAEAELRLSEERIRLATQATGVGIWEWHIAGDRIIWDTQMFNIFGLTPSPDGVVPYQVWRDAVLPEDLPGQEAAMKRTIRSGSRGVRSYRIRRYGDGAIRHIEAVETVRRNAAGRAESVVGTNLDVTEAVEAAAALAAHRDELEERVQERTLQIEAAYRRIAAADRMAAVGTMASGLTHDMNNVLVPLSLRMSAVMATPDLPDTVRADLTAVTKLLGHLREMSRSLSLFSRDPAHEGAVGRTDMSEWQSMVEEFLSLTATGRSGSPDSDDPIRIEWDIPSNLPAAAVAPHRLTQAVLNLVHNARDSIVEGRRQDAAAGRRVARGLILVRVRELSDAGSAGSLALAVSDDGCGMDERTRQRCTEPFFTTKDGASGGGGTGLGMALAHGIVARARGRMEIQSTVGKGTTVTLVFPVAAQETSDAQA